jgi:hypothetical protein
VHEWGYFRIGGKIAISSIFYKELDKIAISPPILSNPLHAPKFSLSNDKIFVVMYRDE